MIIDYLVLLPKFTMIYIDVSSLLRKTAVENSTSIVIHWPVFTPNIFPSSTLEPPSHVYLGSPKKWYGHGISILKKRPRVKTCFALGLPSLGAKTWYPQWQPILWSTFDLNAKDGPTLIG